MEDIIVKGMVGREMLHRYPERPDHFVKPEVGFEIREWNTFHPTYAEQQIVKNASLKVHKGEIVGLYGLMGAGRTEMAMSVFGRSYGQKTSGRIFKDGKEIKLRSVAAAIQKKIAYISEDRKITAWCCQRTSSSTCRWRASPPLRTEWAWWMRTRTWWWRRTTPSG